MEIHQLEYVIALEKYRNFSLAAHEISVSQSTLSDQVKKLENELGIKLFLRTTRKVQLTSAGEEFMIYANRIISEIQNVHNAMSEHSNLLKGKIKIGANPNITYLGITAVIADFKKKYPGLKMELYEANSDILIKKMHASEVDAAFLTSPYISDHEINFHPLIHDKLILFASNSHPLTNRKSVSLSELSQEKFLMIKATTGWRNATLEACRNAGFEPNIIFESSYTETIKGLIEEGVGIALFTNRIAAAVSSPKTAIINLKNTVRSVTGLATPKKTELLSTKAFRDFVLNSMRMK